MAVTSLGRNFKYHSAPISSQQTRALAITTRISPEESETSPFSRCNRQPGVRKTGWLSGQVFPDRLSLVRIRGRKA
jgi:hypothetical protein